MLLLVFTAKAGEPTKLMIINTNLASYMALYNIMCLGVFIK